MPPFLNEARFKDRRSMKRENIVEITLNGEKRSLDPPLTIIELLHSLGINPQSVVVERNLKIIPHSKMEQEPVQDADTIEIIRLVSGG